MSLNAKSIAQVISNIKVAYISKQKYAKVRCTKSVIKVLIFLKKKKIIIGYRRLNKNFLIIFLRYNNFVPQIQKIKFLQKSRRTSNISHKEVCKIKNDKSSYVLTTKQGLFDLDTLFKLKKGGTKLFEIVI